MSSLFLDSNGLESHLKEALENAESDEAKYHIRESLQKLYASSY
jgi:hypothetical protein